MSDNPISVSIAATSSTALNAVDGSTTAYIQGAGTVTANGNIEVAADNTQTKLTSAVISVAVTASTLSLGIGVSLAENSIANDVTPYIAPKATSIGSNVQVSASSTSDIDDTHAVAVAVAILGVSGSGGHAGANVSGTTDAYLGSHADITAQQGTVEVNS